MCSCVDIFDNSRKVGNEITSITMIHSSGNYDYYSLRANFPILSFNVSHLSKSVHIYKCTEHINVS